MGAPQPASLIPLLVSALLSLVGVPLALTQEEPTPTPYVLHVYTNRIQIPTLVVDGQNRLLPPVAREQFTLRVDSGPPFHPTRIRLAGDDPITLDIVIDASGDEEILLRSFDSALASLAPLALTSRDHVNIYAGDCALVHLSNVRVEPAALQKGIALILHAPGLHERVAAKPACPYRNRLWDSLAVALRNIAPNPGRKVILVIASGEDHGSSNTWLDLEHFANSYSIAVFAVQSYSLAQIRPPSFIKEQEDPLRLLCNLTGGVVMHTYATDLRETLLHFTHLLRGRYILEFPRLGNGTPGNHELDIKVPNRDALVLASGTTAALPTDTEKNDPNNVPSDTSQLPAEGTRRSIKRR